MPEVAAVCFLGSDHASKTVPAFHQPVDLPMLQLAQFTRGPPTKHWLNLYPYSDSQQEPNSGIVYDERATEASRQKRVPVPGADDTPGIERARLYGNLNAQRGCRSGCLPEPSHAS